MRALRKKISALLVITVLLCGQGISVNANVPVEEQGLQLEVEDNINGNNGEQGQEVMLSAEAKGGAGDYLYQYIDANENILQDYSEDNVYSFYADEGENYVLVYVKDKDENIAEYEYKLWISSEEQEQDNQLVEGEESDAFIENTKTPAEDIEISTDLPEEIESKSLMGEIESTKGNRTYLERTTTLSANVQGGYGELQYQFTEEYNGNSVVVKAYSTENSYTFVTEGLGKHTYYIDVKDEKGQSVRYTYVLEVVVHPNNVLSGTIESTKGNRTYLERTTTLSANMQGGYGELQYQFTEVYNGKSKVVQEYGRKKSYTFVTEGLGKHTYYIDVKDEEGQVVRYTHVLEVVTHPDKMIIGNIKSTKGNRTYLERTTTLSANMQGGYGKLQYQFTEEYKGNITVVKTYGAQNLYTFVTEGLGKHTYYVDVKDEKGQSVKYTYILEVVTHPSKMITGNIESTKGNRTYAQRTTTLNANMQGGYGELQYQFTEVYNGKSKVVQEYGREKSYTFVTTGIGKHTFHIDVKDEKGQSKRFSHALTVTIHPDFAIQGMIESSKGNRTYAQRSVSLTAAGAGGYGELQYRFLEEYNGEITVVQDYGIKKEYAFKTTGIGKHRFYVDIKDKEGQVVRVPYDFIVVVHPDYKLSGTFGIKPSGAVTLGQKISLSVNSSGGYDDNHRYQFREVYNGKTTILKSYSAGRTCTTTISGGGTHIYYADIKDSEGQVLTLSRTINTSQAYTYATNVLNQVGWNLQAAFNWSASLPYVNYSNSPAPGSEAMALYGFQNGVGDCYVMAATFYYMAKTLGYNAHQMAGYVPLLNGGMGVHSWVEIDMNGTTYVFDPNFTNQTGRNGFQITYGNSGTWVYRDYYRMN